MGKWTPLASAIIVGALCAKLAEPATFEPAADTLATFASFVAAAIVPTMILAATVLRPARFGLPALRIYRTAIRQQLSFFSGVIVIAALLIVTLVVADLLAWQDNTYIVGEMHRWTFNVSSAAGVNAAIGFLSTLLLCRIFGFVNGVRSLFELHFEMVEQEAADSVRAEARGIFENDTVTKDPRQNFGRVLTPDRDQ